MYTRQTNARNHKIYSLCFCCTITIQNDKLFFIVYVCNFLSCCGCSCWWGRCFFFVQYSWIKQKRQTQKWLFFTNIQLVNNFVEMSKQYASIWILCIVSSLRATAQRAHSVAIVRPTNAADGNKIENNEWAEQNYDFIWKCRDCWPFQNQYEIQFGLLCKWHGWAMNDLNYGLHYEIPKVLYTITASSCVTIVNLNV